MDKIELDNKLEELERKQTIEKKLIIKQYCDSNNTYNVGDVFTDHIGSIMIEKIQYQYHNNPCCVYYGLELKKDKTPTKKGTQRHAWQSNDITKTK